MLACPTVADIWRPCDKKLAAAYELTLILAASLLIALCAQIAVGFPVPITGQTFAVLVIAALLGPRRAPLAVLAYIAEGAAGMPVFANAKAGIPALFGPTAGYIFAFLPAAFLVGTLAAKGWDRRPSTTILAMTLGNLVIYAGGVAWLSVLLGPRQAVAAGVLPCIPGDIVKIAIAAAILPAAWKALERLDPAVRNE